MIEQMRRGRWAVVGAALICATGRAGAQAPAPVPPPDSVVSEVVEILQSGDAARRGAFLARALSAEARRADSARIDGLLARLHEQGAPFTMLGRSTSTRSVFAKLASPGVGRVLALQVATDRADPARLGKIDILESHPAVLDSLRWPGEPLAGPAQVAAAIRANFTRVTAAGAFSGVVYVARGDSVLVEEGFGLADREHGVRNIPESRFALASMGKMFTATAVLQLVEAGKLRLDDTLASVLPEYPNPERARRITLRQLLEHTAGLGDQWSTPPRPVPGLTGSLATVGAVAYAPLLFDPGTRWSYSNEGYNVLAAVVERASGMPFRDYLARHVFAPAGMTGMVMAGGAEDFVPNRAIGYRPGGDDPLGIGAPRANWLFVGRGGMGGAGGGYGTARDLARFGRALREGKLLGGALRDTMWTGRWPIPGYDGERYGMGSFVWEIGGRVAVGHGGGGTGSGMDNGYRQFTDGSYTVVVLTNIDPPAATTLTRELVRFLAAQR